MFGTLIDCFTTVWKLSHAGSLKFVHILFVISIDEIDSVQQRSFMTTIMCAMLTFTNEVVKETVKVDEGGFVYTGWGTMTCLT